jgi:hypothetical protein
MPAQELAEQQATTSEIVLYQTEDGRSRIEVRLKDNAVWLSQRLLSELYQVSVPNINRILAMAARMMVFRGDR